MTNFLGKGANSKYSGFHRLYNLCLNYSALLLYDIETNGMAPIKLLYTDSELNLAGRTSSVKTWSRIALSNTKKYNSSHTEAVLKF